MMLSLNQQKEDLEKANLKEVDANKKEVDEKKEKP